MDVRAHGETPRERTGATHGETPRERGAKTYGEKIRQCDREARITLVALALCIAVWTICGFGLAGVEVTVLGTPLWAVCGTLGTWAFAIVVAVVLSRRFFDDFDVEDEAASPAEVAVAQCDEDSVPPAAVVAQCAAGHGRSSAESRKGRVF